MFIEPENLLPEETGDKEGAGQRQYVNQDPADADVSNLGKRQTKTIKNDPQAQQILLGENHPAVAGLPNFGINGVTDHHAEQNSQRQRAEARAGDSRETACPQGGAGQRGGQRQAWDEMPQGAMFSG